MIWMCIRSPLPKRSGRGLRQKAIFSLTANTKYGIVLCLEVACNTSSLPQVLPARPAKEFLRAALRNTGAPHLAVGYQQSSRASQKRQGHMCWISSPWLCLTKSEQQLPCKHEV